MLLSAKHAHVEVCNTLLDCGADINTCDNSGRYEHTKKKETSDTILLKRNNSVLTCSVDVVLEMSVCTSVLQDSLDAGS